jgi:hypothetical protein
MSLDPRLRWLERGARVLSDRLNDLKLDADRIQSRLISVGAFDGAPVFPEEPPPDGVPVACCPGILIPFTLKLSARTGVHDLVWSETLGWSSAIFQWQVPIVYFSTAQGCVSIGEPGTLDARWRMIPGGSFRLQLETGACIPLFSSLFPAFNTALVASLVQGTTICNLGHCQPFNMSFQFNSSFVTRWGFTPGETAVVYAP